MLTINDILINKKKRDAKRLEVFNHILEMCCKVIRKSDDLKITFCVFEVPEYLFGYPLYNLNECVTHVIKELAKAGFQVRYIFPSTLIISWHNAVNNVACAAVDYTPQETSKVVPKGKAKGKGNGAALKKNANGKFVVSLG